MAHYDHPKHLYYVHFSCLLFPRNWWKHSCQIWLRHLPHKSYRRDRWKKKHFKGGVVTNDYVTHLKFWYLSHILSTIFQNVIVVYRTALQYTHCVHIKGVHGNRNQWNSVGPMGFPRYKTKMLLGIGMGSNVMAAGSTTTFPFHSYDINDTTLLQFWGPVFPQQINLPLI